MTQIIYYVAASVDGYIATPDGSVKWLSPYETAGEDYGYADFYNSVDAVLLGSRTYEQILTFGAWPYPGKPCWVFSNRKIDIRQPDLILTAESPARIVSELNNRGLKRAWLVGGGTLAASFREQGLITEYIISIIPVILGSGIPMFASPGQVENLKLVQSKSYSNGVVQLHYLRAEP